MIFNKDSQKEHTRTYYTKKGIKTVKVNKGNKKDDKLALGIGLGVAGTLGVGYLLRKKLIPKNSVPTNIVKSIPVETFTPKKAPTKVKFPKVTNNIVESKPKYIPENIPDPWLGSVVPTPKPKLELSLDDIIQTRTKSKWRNKKVANNQVESASTKLRSKPKPEQPTRTLIYLGKQAEDSKIKNINNILIKDLRLPLDSIEAIEFKSFMLGNYTDARRHLLPNPKKLNTIRNEGKNLIDKYGLTDNDVIALASYTDNGYVGVNGTLRNQITNEDIIQPASLLTRQINQTLDKLPLYNGNVYRGTRLTKDLIDGYNIGDTITLQGLTSSTKVPINTDNYARHKIVPLGKEYLLGSNVEKYYIPTTKQSNYEPIAKEFGIDTTHKKNELPVKMIIYSKSGRYIPEPLSSTPTDIEVLFKSNSKFKVLKKEQMKEGVWQFTMQELDYDEVISNYYEYNYHIISFNKSRSRKLPMELLGRLNEPLLITKEK